MIAPGGKFCSSITADWKGASSINDTINRRIEISARFPDGHLAAMYVCPAYTRILLDSRDFRREDPQESGQKTVRIVACQALQPALEDSPMYILRALAFFFLAQVVLAGQPTPVFPDPKLTPGDTFDVTAQDVCVPGYAKKVRAVPAWLKRQAYAEYGITEYKTGNEQLWIRLQAAQRSPACESSCVSAWMDFHPKQTTRSVVQAHSIPSCEGVCHPPPPTRSASHVSAVSTATNSLSKLC